MHQIEVPITKRIELLRIGVNWFCSTQKIALWKLAQILDVSVESLRNIISDSYIQTAETAETLFRVFWIVGLNEANPVYFGFSSQEKDEWMRTNVERVDEKRQELYDTAVTIQSEYVRRDYHATKLSLLIAVVVLVIFGTVTYVLLAFSTIPPERLVITGLPAAYGALLTVPLLIAVLDKRKKVRELLPM